MSDIAVCEESPLLLIIPSVELSVPEFRGWIVEMENRMLADSRTCDRHNQEDNGFGLHNTFTPGLYTRQLFMPKDSIVVSRIHMHEHPFIISKGKVSVYDGTQIVTYTAPYQGVTKPGTKRILYTHEDTVWTTFHVTDKCTLEDVDVNGVVTCDTYEEFDKLVMKEITL